MTERKRPSIRRKASSREGGIRAVVSPSGGSDGGLLASLLGDIEETHKKLGSTKATNKQENIAGCAATAHRQRTEFVADVEKQLREHVVNSVDDDACLSFPPAEKRWRDLIHETAADLKLHSWTTTSMEDEEKYVVVGKSMGGELHGRGLSARVVAARPEKRKEVLSDMAPSADDAFGGASRLNTQKRDLRSIEQIQADMQSRVGKSQRLE